MLSSREVFFLLSFIGRASNCPLKRVSEKIECSILEPLLKKCSHFGILMPFQIRIFNYVQYNESVYPAPNQRLSPKRLSGHVIKFHFVASLGNLSKASFKLSGSMLQKLDLRFLCWFPLHGHCLMKSVFLFLLKGTVDLQECLPENRSYTHC